MRAAVRYGPRDERSFLLTDARPEIRGHFADQPVNALFASATRDGLQDRAPDLVRVALMPAT